jgi:hypothetical protein
MLQRIVSFVQQLRRAVVHMTGAGAFEATERRIRAYNRLDEVQERHLKRAAETIRTIGQELPKAIRRHIPNASESQIDAILADVAREGEAASQRLSAVDAAVDLIRPAEPTPP